MHPKAKLGAVADGGGWSSSVSPPENVTVNAGDSQLGVFWTNIIGVTYNVYRGLSDNDVILIATGQTGELSYVDTNVQNGTEYFYKVTARVNGAESAFSNTASGIPIPSP